MKEKKKFDKITFLSFNPENLRRLNNKYLILVPYTINIK